MYSAEVEGLSHPCICLPVSVSQKDLVTLDWGDEVRSRPCHITFHPSPPILSVHLSYTGHLVQDMAMIRRRF